MWLSMLFIILLFVFILLSHKTVNVWEGKDHLLNLSQMFGMYMSLFNE